MACERTQTITFTVRQPEATLAAGFDYIEIRTPLDGSTPSHAFVWMATRMPVKKARRAAIGCYGSINDIAFGTDYATWDRSFERKMRTGYTKQHAGARAKAGRPASKPEAKRGAEAAELEAAADMPADAAAPAAIRSEPQQPVPWVPGEHANPSPASLGACAEYNKRIIEHGPFADMYKKMVEENRNKYVTLAEYLARKEALSTLDFSVPGRRRPSPPPGQEKPPSSFLAPAYFLERYRKYKSLIAAGTVKETCEDQIARHSLPKRSLDNPIDPEERGTFVCDGLDRLCMNREVNITRDIAHMLEKRGTVEAMAEAGAIRLLLVRYDAAAFLPSIMMADEERVALRGNILMYINDYEAQLENAARRENRHGF